MKTQASTLTKYAHSYFIFEGFAAPVPTIPCAHCGEDMPDNEKPFWRDSDTDLIFCSLKCAKHELPMSDKMAHVRQSRAFALLALNSFGLIG